MKYLSIVDHYSEMDIDELEVELEDLNYSIEEEYRRCRNAEHQATHLEIIRKYKEERAYVIELMKGLMDE